MSSISLRELQERQFAWAYHNFGKTGVAERGEDRAVWSLLGVMEEVGEIAHAFLKRHQGIRGSHEQLTADIEDGTADLLVFLADFCTREGIDLQAAIDKVWPQVEQRDWRKFPKNGVSE